VPLKELSYQCGCSEAYCVEGMRVVEKKSTLTISFGGSKTQRRVAEEDMLREVNERTAADFRG
jgi:hypothetical protein